MKCNVASWCQISFTMCVLLVNGCNQEADPTPEVPTIPVDVSPVESEPAPGPPADELLTIDDYIRAGVPSHDRTWSGDDMRRAADALTRLAKSNAANLPRYEGARSGAVFARLVADDNLDLSRNRSIPIDQRLPNASQLMRSTNQILKVYLAASTRRTIGGSELVELMGAQLRTSSVLFQMVNEMLPTLDKKAPSYQVRMSGLEQMKNGVALVVFGCLQTLTESHPYRTSELKRLTGYLQETSPQILPELSTANFSEVVVRVREMANDDEMAHLRPELKSLLVVAEAVARKRELTSTDTSPKRPHSLNFNEVAVGTLRRDGWVRAVSKSAGFSVLLPGKYNDFSQSTVTKKGNPLKTHHLGMKTPDGVTYSVMALEGGDKKTATEFLESCSAGATNDDTVCSQKNIELSGNPGVEYTVLDSKSGAVFRGYYFNEMSYMLIAEYPAHLAKTESAEVQKFLDSFEPR